MFLSDLSSFYLGGATKLIFKIHSNKPTVLLYLKKGHDLDLLKALLNTTTAISLTCCQVTLHRDYKTGL
jgi:hypothetical protein